MIGYFFLPIFKSLWMMSRVMRIKFTRMFRVNTPRVTQPIYFRNSSLCWMKTFAHCSWWCTCV